MMIHAAINILILSGLLLIVGLWKPKILLFWMDEPKRLPIIVMFFLLLMVGATLFGEATRQKQLEQAALQTKKIVIDKATTTETSEDIPRIIEKKSSPTTEITTTSTP